MHASSHERGVRDTIADWVGAYRLTEDDVETLRLVATDYEPAQTSQQLRVRLRKILALRAVVTLPPAAAAHYLEVFDLAPSRPVAFAAIKEVNRLAELHRMDLRERTNLCAVLTEVPEPEWGVELEYEVSGVLAARRIGMMGMPTEAGMGRIRDAMAGTSSLPPFIYPND